MAHWSRLFSLPHPTPDERVFDAVNEAYGRTIAEWLVSTYCNEIAEDSEGLVAYVLDWAAGSSCFEVVWDIAFGRAQCLLKGNSLEPVEVAARLALRLVEMGHPGMWRVTIPPQTIIFNRMIVPHVSELRVRSSDGIGHVVACCADGTRIALEWETTAAWSAHDVEHLRSFGAQRPILLVPDYALPANGTGAQRFVGMGGTAVPMVSDEMVNSFAQGFAVLEQCAPAYVPWVERVLRGVVVCPVEVGFRVVSGSAEDAPGFIHASYPVKNIEIAEMLVHECAHQYFYMLERVGPLDDGSDNELYWSPPIRMKRPLSRILMAYHAVANIRLFYESVRTGGGADVAYVEANEADVDEALVALAAPLGSNSALTDLGRGLYEPLVERLEVLRR